MFFFETTICRLDSFWRKDYRVKKKRNTKFRGEFLFHASKIWISLFVRNGYR